MTITAGFRCKNGVVLCADSEITLTQGKTYEAKLFTINEEQEAYLAYAGSSFFIKELVGSLRDTSEGKTGKTLIDAIRKTYKSLHNKHYTKPPKGEKSFADILVTARHGKWISLYAGSGRHWFLVDKYQTFGVGQDQAEPIFNPLYSSDISTTETSFMAIYALRRIKGFVQGCGGPTEIRQVDDAGRFFSRYVWGKERIKRAEEDYDFFEKTMRPILLSLPDTLSTDKKKFNALVSQMVKELRRRRAGRLQIEEREFNEFIGKIFDDKDSK